LILLTGQTQKQLKSLEFLATHFQVPLESAGFDGSKLKHEWSDLKRVVRFFYKGAKAKVMWEQIFEYRKSEFPNICLIAEMVLCLGPSNSMVEKCFSQLSAMLSDRRLSLGHGTMEDLLMVKVNDLSWDSSEREEIINIAPGSPPEGTICVPLKKIEGTSSYPKIFFFFFFLNSQYGLK
jgi:hypothetical protein